eukprot:TRINITY_DN11172_c0_g1_i2.p1 TRINITY_DN11172_c0_g1~~TRINITY_DN11172_c0_g1_i2.p1  ORF type:complete len:270 (+),score=59.52 TRINITY_DN11172_c0_g1_i2:353-1162(+)
MNINCIKANETDTNIPIMSEEDIKIYGQKILDGFEKIRLLGKGGFAIVWLARNKQTKQIFAIKQMQRFNLQENSIRELQFLNNFFSENGQTQDRFMGHPGIKGIIQCYGYKQTQKYFWIIYEYGGETISKSLFQMKGEFFRGERLYRINQLPLYEKFINLNQYSYLKQFIRQMGQTLQLLSEENIVHCDIKPENILVTDNGNQFDVLKLIDYGSCFSICEKGSIIMATAEYMPHEVLEAVSYTHLTLPTICSVQISVVAVSLKKKNKKK